MTVRRGRLSPRPKSWGRLLLSGQRVPAAPETTRKEVTRGLEKMEISVQSNNVNNDTKAMEQ